MPHPVVGLIAPEIPEFGAVAGVFFAVLGVIMARGAIATWTHSFGYLLEWLADQLSFTVKLGWFSKKIDLGGPFRAADHWVLTALQTWLAGSEIMLTKCLHASAVLWDWTVAQIEKLARDTEHALSWTWHSGLPALLHANLYPLRLLLRAARAQLHAIQAIAHGATVLVHELERSLSHRIVGLIRRYAVAAVPGAVALPGLLHEWRTFSRRWELWKKRIRRLEVLLGVTGMAVAMSNVLGVPWRCLRPRGPIGRLAKALCGLETAFLAALLATAFEAFAILDLCGLIAAEEKLAAWFRPLLMDLVDVDEWLIQNCGYTAPAPLTLATIKLPKGRYGLTLNEELDFKLGLAG